MLTVGLAALSLWPLLTGLFEKAKVTAAWIRQTQLIFTISVTRCDCIDDENERIIIKKMTNECVAALMVGYANNQVWGF